MCARVYHMTDVTWKKTSFQLQPYNWKRIFIRISMEKLEEESVMEERGRERWLISKVAWMCVRVCVICVGIVYAFSDNRHIYFSIAKSAVLEKLTGSLSTNIGNCFYHHVKSAERKKQNKWFLCDRMIYQWTFLRKHASMHTNNEIRDNNPKWWQQNMHTHTRTHI